MAEATWEEIKQLAKDKAAPLGKTYTERLTFEIREIQKQGAVAKWLNYYNDNKKFDSAKNHMLLAWLIGLVDNDPLSVRKEPLLNTVRASTIMAFSKEHGYIPSDIVKDPDMPDIDIDCLPEAKDHIKEYAMQRYNTTNDGYGSVCSVGTWQTYKLKQAIVDACQATGKVDKQEAYELTTNLEDEVDDLKDGGMSTCKGRIINNETGEDKECGHTYNNMPVLHRTADSGVPIREPSPCPKCGSVDTDSPTLGKLLATHDNLYQFQQRYPDIIEYAVGLIGRVRNMGMHAGALIITDRPLYGNIPLAKGSGKGYWVSMWSEGRNTQLSKFGYVKWDILGLKTLKYIFNCCQLIQQNRGISFGEPVTQFDEDGKELPPTMSGWDDIDPTVEVPRAGHFFDGSGNKIDIELNDRYALTLANEQKTDGVFQFDTDLAKQILQNGVRTFDDLMLFNAMGHPGPMASIPDAVSNRDDKRGFWRHKLHPEILEVLKDTYGVIVYQEQLQAIWQIVAGFTAPEAQEARKAVAKKWAHKLKPIRDKWIQGAARKLGEKEAIEWWSKMETFGRYAFNKSHAVSYCLVAHRCLWLKAHFAPEFWASVMSDCHPDKLVRYMGVARSEGWKPTEVTYCGRHKPATKARGVVFDTINVENLTATFTVTGDVVNQGLIGIKGIGDSAATVWEGKRTFTGIDDLAEKNGKSRTVFERFIKLGALRRFPGYENAYATWQYYMYKYCSGKDITILRQKIRQQLLEADGWTPEAIAKEIQRQTEEYRKLYPKRRKIPAKITNWKPIPEDSPEKVMALFPNDFSINEILDFEKEYLGYWLHSPLDLYDIHGTYTIEAAKTQTEDKDAWLEVVVTDKQEAMSKKNTPYVRLYVSDGVQNALILIFSKELDRIDKSHLKPGTGIGLFVEYDKMRGTFVAARNQNTVKLQRR